MLLRNTAWLVGSVEIVALPVAAVLALLLARTNVTGKTAALFMCSSLLSVPLYLYLCGWEAALGRQGWHTYLFDRLDEPWLSHWRGAVFVHSVYAIPWATCLMAAAFSQGEREHEESALLEGDTWQVFSRLTLRQLAGGLLIAAAWVFVITAGEMTVTNIYLVHTYAEDIYNFHALNASVQSAVIHNGPMFLFTAALVLLFLAVARPTAMLVAHGKPHQWRLGGLQPAATLAMLITIGGLLVVPILNLLERLGEQVVLRGDVPVRTWSGEKMLGVLMNAPGKFYGEFELTFWIGATTAAIAVMVALVLAWLGRRSMSVSALSWISAAVAIALPGPVIGLLVVSLLNHDHPLLIWLYDRTIFPPVLALLVRTLPLVFLALWWAMQTLDREPLDAASLDGAGSWGQFAYIAAPQRWPVIIVSALAAFVVASGDLSASILTIPPLESEPIARRMFGLIHIGTYDEVAAIGLICWLGYVLIAAAAVWILRASAWQPR